MMWNMSGLSVLIPKRRGSGFLKCPLGHHHVPELAKIEYDEAIDLCGLEGYLHLDYRFREEDERREIEARVMPRLAAHYGFSAWREDRDEFWRVLLPNAIAQTPPDSGTKNL